MANGSNVGEGEKPEKKKPERPGYKLVYTPFFRTKNGKVIYASSYGKKVFAFWVRDDK